MSIISARLSIGDTIGIVTPSAAVDVSPFALPQQELWRVLDYLKQLGFQVILGKHALRQGAFGAGTPRERAEDINEMFANPEIQAIFSSHGGVFANPCLPHLDYDLMRRRPKILMGFSDVSTLHLAIYARSGLVTLHGIMVMSYFGMAPQASDRQEFLARLDADSATLHLIGRCVG